MMINFELKPFPQARPIPDIQLTGQVERQGTQWRFTYQLHGEIEKVFWPPLHPTPTRQYGLWETTCLECFIGIPGEPGYWEFNFAPSGDWNAYHLSRYRQDFTETSEFDLMSIEVTKQPSQLMLTVPLNLAELIAPDQELELSITAVVQAVGGGCSYWAIAHTGPEADFHRRDSFVLRI